MSKDEKYTCIRCDGQQTLCRGCSGLSGDWPELFGGCDKMVDCPYCKGRGITEATPEEQQVRIDANIERHKVEDERDINELVRKHGKWIPLNKSV